MILQIEDWKFDIDMVRTMEYSSTEAAEHCDCAYCRNFYAAVDEKYPALRPFLAQFGVDIEAPVELMPYDINEEMFYDGVYVISGSIIRSGAPIVVDDISIQPTLETDVNHTCPSPCFALNVGTVILPWVLDEPMKDTVSPANLPSFLGKMWRRLLGKAPKDDTLS